MIILLVIATLIMLLVAKSNYFAGLLSLSLFIYSIPLLLGFDDRYGSVFSLASKSLYILAAVSLALPSLFLPFVVRPKLLGKPILSETHQLVDLPVNSLDKHIAELLRLSAVLLVAPIVISIILYVALGDVVLSGNKSALLAEASTWQSAAINLRNISLIFASPVLFLLSMLRAKRSPSSQRSAKDNFNFIVFVYMLLLLITIFSGYRIAIVGSVFAAVATSLVCIKDNKSFNPYARVISALAGIKSIIKKMDLFVVLFSLVGLPLALFIIAILKIILATRGNLDTVALVAIISDSCKGFEPCNTASVTQVYVDDIRLPLSHMLQSVLAVIPNTVSPNDDVSITIKNQLGDLSNAGRGFSILGELYSIGGFSAVLIGMLTAGILVIKIESSLLRNFNQILSSVSSRRTVPNMIGACAMTTCFFYCMVYSWRNSIENLLIFARNIVMYSLFVRFAVRIRLPRSYV